MMNLEKLGLSFEDVLQRSQLVSIIGGTGDQDLDDGDAGCLDMKCGSDHPGNVCCAQTSCDSVKNGFCKLN